nr:hypothetical protein [Mycobacterium sp. E3298]
MANSRGWTKIVEERKIDDEEEATDYMVMLLEKLIDEMRNSK